MSDAAKGGVGGRAGEQAMGRLGLRCQRQHQLQEEICALGPSALNT